MCKARGVESDLDHPAKSVVAVAMWWYMFGVSFDGCVLVV